MYLGNALRGWIILLSVILLVCLVYWFTFSPTGSTYTSLALVLITGLISIWNLFDAYQCAKKANTPNFEISRTKSKDSWLAVFLSLFIPGVGHIYLKKISIGICLIIISIILNSLNLVIVWYILCAFVAYHAYVSSPVRRESSENLIMTITILSLASKVVSLLIFLGFTMYLSSSV